MFRIIDTRGSGKTSRLMLLAKETGSMIACANPSAMRQKALAYGIVGIDFIHYRDLFSGQFDEEDKVMIDEMEQFVAHFIDNKLTGYSLTNED